MKNIVNNALLLILMIFIISCDDDSENGGDQQDIGRLVRWELLDKGASIDIKYDDQGKAIEWVDNSDDNEHQGVEYITILKATSFEGDKPAVIEKQHLGRLDDTIFIDDLPRGYINYSYSGENYSVAEEDEHWDDYSYCQRTIIDGRTTSFTVYGDKEMAIVKKNTSFSVDPKDENKLLMTHVYKEDGSEETQNFIVNYSDEYSNYLQELDPFFHKLDGPEQMLLIGEKLPLSVSNADDDTKPIVTYTYTFDSKGRATQINIVLDDSTTRLYTLVWE